MTTFASWGVVVDHLNVASHLEERINGLRKSLRINKTQMLLLALLHEVARSGPTKARAGVSPTDLAAQIHQSRAMVSIQLKGLVDEKLVKPSYPGLDRRFRNFRITPAGEKKAKKVVEMLEQLHTVLGAILQTELERALSRGLRRLVEELPTVPPLTQPYAARQYRADLIRKRRGATVAAKKVTGR